MKQIEKKSNSRIINLYQFRFNLSNVAKSLLKSEEMNLCDLATIRGT